MVRVKMVNNYLTGKCLVSMPHIDDDVFSRSVVYICMHNQEGAMGFMVNKQLKEFYFSDLISQLTSAARRRLSRSSFIRAVRWNGSAVLSCTVWTIAERELCRSTTNLPFLPPSTC